MRLLNLNSLKFREFHPSTTPRYVVASHQWVQGDGEEREATFQDVKDKQNVTTIGYQKIINFAVYMREHMPSIDWLWIDTGCINKQDAQEVTEAINSMFKWYRDSAVCLAYLADVRTSDDMDGFVRSQWFKRGWTLQELLASRIVIFLSHDWQVIGHKRCNVYEESDFTPHLGGLLHASITGITNIPEAVLSDFQRSRGLTVEERLAWTNGRKTTREEDMSYSLLGIFGVSMPAIYGEGVDRAQRRLLSEISRDKAVLDRLSEAPGAAFDSEENDFVSECLPNTRVDLLREIDEWASSEDGACIFWLGGKAGTGKSTVFKTVAQKFQNQHRLAASFCFKRGEASRGNASRLITTISAQLAERLSEIRDAVISVLEKNPDVVRKSLKEQFQKLILQPLEHFASPPVYGPTWIIGIDALDECDDESDIDIVVDLLMRLKELKSANFRLFVTSRPDLPLRLAFSRMSEDAYVNVRLEDIPEDVVTQDIAVYLRHKLVEIRSNYISLNGIHALRYDWPGEDAIQALVQIAQPLFIFAATACRLLGEPDEDPTETLRMILEHRLEAAQLDRTYQPVLDRLLVNKTSRQQERIVEEFKAVVGSIVILAEPLTLAALSRMLEMPREKMSARLQRLHSVLDVPLPREGSRPVRSLHLSFRDFLTDSDSRKKTPFWIDKAQQHRTLASRCLRLLSQSGILKEDLCSVEKPGTLRAEVDRQRVQNSITSDVAYACSYWVLHLAKGGERLSDDSQTHQFLLLHFLHWLEALSWLGRASMAITYISDLQSLTEADKGQALIAFLDDAQRFVLRNRYVIEFAPLQTYSSALVFTPTQSIVRQQYEDSVPGWLCLRPEVASEWSAEILRLEGHYGGVNAVAFSPDGFTVVSGSHDTTVRLWNARTGEEREKLEGHDDDVQTVAFSPDGLTVATGSYDGTVWLRNARTGEERERLEGDDAVRTVAFSPDGLTVTAGLYDGTVWLWNARTGMERKKLEGHIYRVQAVAFSPDGQRVAVGSYDGTVWLRNARTGWREKLEGHDAAVLTVAFSPDGLTVASGSVDRTVRIWNANTGREIHKLKGHLDDVVAVAFSPDGLTVASGSDDRTVRLWNVRKGEERERLEGHSHSVNAIAFSPDGRMVASGSKDMTVRLWTNASINQEMQELEKYGQTVASALTGKKMENLKGYRNRVTKVAFSLDRETVASSSIDGTVRLWNADIGKEIQKLEGPSDWEALAVSPDGQRVAVGSYDGTVWLWNARAGWRREKLEGHNGAVRTVAFSPDGLTVASGSVDKTVRLWDANKGKETYKLKGHFNNVIAVAFSLDGQTVASASFDRTVRLWNACTGEEFRQFQVVKLVHRLVFNKDGISWTTSSGSYNVQLDIPSSQVSHHSSATSPLVVRGQWVRYQDQDLLWLPHEYRGYCWDALGDKLVIGQQSGAVSLFRFKVD